jgi:hypothetical protein
MAAFFPRLPGVLIRYREAASGHHCHCVVASGHRRRVERCPPATTGQPPPPSSIGAAVCRRHHRVDPVPLAATAALVDTLSPPLLRSIVTWFMIMN